MWAKVRTPDGNTDTFEIVQGDTLVPFLFIVVLDYALCCAIDGKDEEFGFTLVKHASRPILAKMITAFDFADDIVLASDTAECAALLLTKVKHHCRRIGLQLNAKKTQVMAFHSADDAVKTKLEVVQNFKYLGAWIASSAKDIKVRRALGWSALHKMKRIWV